MKVLFFGIAVFYTFEVLLKSSHVSKMFPSDIVLDAPLILQRIDEAVAFAPAEIETETEIVAPTEQIETAPESTSASTSTSTPATTKTTTKNNAKSVGDTVGKKNVNRVGYGIRNESAIALQMQNESPVAIQIRKNCFASNSDEWIFWNIFSNRDDGITPGLLDFLIEGPLDVRKLPSIFDQTICHQDCPL